MPPNKWTAAISLALLLVGCRVQPVQHAPPGTGVPPPPTGAAVYRIDAARSELRVLVFRAGPMARLGHDHVIRSRQLAGWIHLSDGSSTASFRLEIPSDGFAVDDWQDRSAEGADFAEPVSEDAKQGTRHNMLGSALLDAERHSLIIVQSIGIEGSEPALTATVSIAVAGHETQQRIPFVLVRSATQLDASADFRLMQSSLGLTPFSIMMGALQVQDEMRVKIKVVALPASSEVDPRGVEPRGAGQGRNDDRSPLGREE